MDSIGIPLRVLDGDFAGWLRDAMAARRVSARGVAMRTGIHHTTVTRLALGEQQPTLTSAVALLRLLSQDPMVGPADTGNATPETRSGVMLL